MIATGRPVGDTLDQIALFVEAEEPGSRASIFVISPNGNLFIQSHGPSLPGTYHAAVDGLPITPPFVGACAAALTRCEPLSVPDVAADKIYSPFWRELLLSHGLYSVRSTPILADDGRPIASLAIYYTTVRTPLPDNPALIETATHLAAIALERDREKSAAAEREARLQATANTFHALVRNTPFGLWVADSDLRIFEASSTAIEAFGLPNLVGTELAEAFRVMWPEPLASEALARFRHTLQTGESYSATTTDQRRDRRDTETHDWRIERIVLPDGRHGVVCHFYELTARVRAEKALEESEARLRLATDAAEIGFWDVDPINDILFWPPIVKAMFGISPAAPVTMLEDFYACLHPDDRSHVAAAFAAACDPQQRALYDVEYRTIGKEDGVLRWVAAKGRGIFDSDGRCVRVIGTAIDISSRKAVSEALARSEADLRQLNEGLEERIAREMAAREEAQQRLAHLQRMEALGQLAGGIAHDFNNVLQAVRGGAGLIERRASNASEVRRFARMLIGAADRGASVTRRLLAFSRRGDLRAEPFDPIALLEDIREILSHTLGSGIGVRVEASPDTPPVYADKGQLETVLINLATNARDAMSGKGVLTLSAARERHPNRRDGIRPPRNLSSGDYVRLAVSDTGVGIAPDVLARVIEPFFTTKPDGQGTGLGLAMARGFIEQSGGSIAIESELGRGTTIHLWLPVATADPRKSSPVSPPHGIRHDTARILLVDDEEIVREVISEQLISAGYDVTSVASASAALAMIREDHSIDLLISDLSMPGMDGITLAQETNKLRPKLPAILLTGFATNAAEIAVGGAVSGLFSLMRKPVSETELTDRIKLLLEGMRANAPGA